MFHRPDLPIVLPLPLKDLLDLLSGGVSSTVPPRLPVRRMRLMDDFLFNFSLPLQHPVIPLCCSNAPGIHVRVKLYVLGLLDGHFFHLLSGQFFKIFKAGVHRIACTAQIVEQAVTGIIRQNPVKFNLRHSTWIVQYLYDFHHGFGFVLFVKCVQAKVPRFKAGRAITFAVVNGLRGQTHPSSHNV